MKSRATVSLKLPSKKEAQIIVTSLKPETLRGSSHRSEASVRTEGRVLVLEIEAKDTTALRASLNAYLRWINSIFDILKNLKANESLH